MTRNFSIKPDPSKDQHFLKDPAIIRKIVGLSKAKRGDVILEVGAGIGTLTEHLIKTNAMIIAVEIDRRLGRALGRLKAGNLEVRYENILDTIDSTDFNKIVSNTPYSICEPLLGKLSGKRFKIAVMSVPEKFFNIMSSKPGEKLYSSMSLKLQAFFDFDFRFRIPRGAFEPEPRTETVVMTLRPLSTEFYRENQDVFILREIILQKTKLLKNSLVEALINLSREIKGRRFTKNMARDAIRNLGLDERLMNKIVYEMKLKDFEAVRNGFRDFSCKPRTRAG